MRVLDGKCVAAFEKEQLIKGLAALGKKERCRVWL